MQGTKYLIYLVTISIMWLSLSVVSILNMIICVEYQPIPTINLNEGFFLGTFRTNLLKLLIFLRTKIIGTYF